MVGGVEMIPKMVRCDGGNRVRCRDAGTREDKGDVSGGGGTREHRVRVHTEEPSKTSWPNSERLGVAAPEQRESGIALGNVDEMARHQPVNGRSPPR